MSLRFYHPAMLKLLSGALRATNWYRGRRSDSRLSEEYRATFYADVWRDAAARLGASIKPLGKDILEIRFGPLCTRVRQNTTAIDDPVTLSIAGNKPMVYRLLAERGLCVPKYFEFTLKELSKAADFMTRFGGEWVIKPANGGGGRGVTTGVSSSFGLIRAAVAAAAYESTLILEQQIEGDLYRLLYLNGTLLDAVLRKCPVVAADGSSNVRQLVHLENQTRMKGGPRFAHGLVSIDTDMRRTLAKQGLTLSSVPKKGTLVSLKRVINENSAAENLMATNVLCKSIIEDGAAAAMAIGVKLAAVDIITPDPAVPLADSGGVILEVNTTPGYHCHYHRQGDACQVAVHVLSCIMERAQTSANQLAAQQLC